MTTSGNLRTTSGNLRLASLSSLRRQSTDDESEERQSGEDNVKKVHSSTNRYPTPRTVSKYFAASPSFSRKRRMCVSTVRVSMALS